MFNKMLAAIKSNKFLLFFTVILIIIISYIVARIIGVFNSFNNCVFLSMYKAKDKKKHITGLKYWF